jgi:hypothetical protein
MFFGVIVDVVHYQNSKEKERKEKLFSLYLNQTPYSQGQI